MAPGGEAPASGRLLQLLVLLPREEGVTSLAPLSWSICCSRLLQLANSRDSSRWVAWLRRFSTSTSLSASTAWTRFVIHIFHRHFHAKISFIFTFCVATSAARVTSASLLAIS